MPKAPEYPSAIKPYIFHGMDLSQSSGGQWVGECPFCSKDKFFVDEKKGLWNCRVCGTGNEKGGGNSTVFIKKLWEIGLTATDASDYSELAAERGLMSWETPKKWGLVKSIIRPDEWLVPAFSPSKQLCQLYRYGMNYSTQKRVLYATSELGHGMYGVNILNPKAQTIYLLEGPWDGMALYEVLKGVKRSEGKLSHTSNEKINLLGSCGVLATPGCNVWNKGWDSFLSGKEAAIMFDNDHRKTVNWKVVEPPGWMGAERISKALFVADKKPSKITALTWGEEGFDPDLPSGHDVRDVLKGSGDTITERVLGLQSLFDLIKPIPAEWIGGRSEIAVASGKPSMQLLPCNSYKDLVNSWRKAMKWIDGLDHALAVMLASATSTMMVGDQLWIKVIGPASCGKTTIAEALAQNDIHVMARSTIRGFHSGFKAGPGKADDQEDHSLISKLDKKTFIIKDGDTLLKSPNLEQILSEARDIYDRTSRVNYRNSIDREYKNISMTWIICGTSSIRVLDSSELGERFLDCVVMEKIDDDIEDEILLRVANQAAKNTTLQVDGSDESQMDENRTEAYQKTGGYVGYLRENANLLANAVEKSTEALRMCIDLGKFVAYVRARPGSQDETAEREFGARLVSQIVRLATNLAVVLNKKELDKEVMRRARRVALDTARGQTLEIISLLFSRGELGTTSGDIQLVTNMAPTKCTELLRFLNRIGAIDKFRHEEKVGNRVISTNRFRLAKKMRDLYSRVDPLGAS